MKLLHFAGINLLPFIIMCLMMYFIGSFVAVTFDPSGWTLELREFMALAGIAWGVALWVRFKWAGLV